MKTILRSDIAATSLRGISGTFVHPFGQSKVHRASKPLLAGAEALREVAHVLERSPQNCRSERIDRSWKGHILPASWLIESDLHQTSTPMNPVRSTEE